MIPEKRSMAEIKNDFIIEEGVLPRKLKTLAVLMGHSSIFYFKSLWGIFLMSETLQATLNFKF